MDATLLTEVYPLSLHDALPIYVEAVPAEPRQQRCLQVELRPGRREVDISIRYRVHERSNQLRAADGSAAVRPDAGCQPVEEDDLAVEEHDGDLGPGLLVHGRPAWPSFARRLFRRRENIRRRSRRFPYLTPRRHGSRALS